MSDNKFAINEEDLDKVIGGLFTWYPKYNVMDYKHKDGSTTRHTYTDYNAAHARSCELHGQNIPEDKILATLQKEGLVN